MTSDQKKSIGWAMLVLAAIMLFSVAVAMIGFINALCIIGGCGVFAALIVGGIALVFSE